MIASADEYHAAQAIEAANKGKHVFIEKPMTLTRDEARQVEEARKRNKVHISIGYMRRYTPVWAQFLTQLSQAGPISFARVFDYSGPNGTFVSQSSTLPHVFSDDIPKEAVQDKQALSKSIAAKALGNERAQDARLVKIFRLLGSLGSHDISCMRHAFGGVPRECLSAFASPSGDFVAASFVYDQHDGPPFQVSYETGIHQIGTFDAYIEVYCRDRIVRIDYDTPYIKGLPITLTIRENSGIDGQGYQESRVRPTFEDAYSAEFVRLANALRQPWDAVVSERQSTDREHWGQSGEMCSPCDGMHDLDVFDQILKHLA